MELEEIDVAEVYPIVSASYERVLTPSDLGIDSPSAPSAIAALSALKEELSILAEGVASVDVIMQARGAFKLDFVEYDMARHAVRFVSAVIALERGATLMPAAEAARRAWDSVLFEWGRERHWPWKRVKEAAAAAGGRGR